MPISTPQLVKHGFGLVTDARRHARRPVLLYLFAEPATLRGKPIDAATKAAHRAEVAQFAAAVAGADVRFAALSYRDYLANWPDEPALTAHRAAVMDRFAP